MGKGRRLDERPAQDVRTGVLEQTVGDPPLKLSLGDARSTGMAGGEQAVALSGGSTRA
jgi:hypothetical protein